MKLVEYIQALEEMLELPPGTVRGGDVLKELAGWDSMAVLTVLSYADENFGLALDPEAIGRCKLVNDLVALHGAHLKE